jgi:group I intron endonuclease
MAKCGVYKIVSTYDTDRLYIGSSVDLMDRKKSHFRDLFRNNHHAIKLQRHYNKYGDGDLIFNIIEFCERKLKMEGSNHGS